MKITETSGNSSNRIRGQRISVYAEINNKMYLVDRFVVTSKYGAVNYCKAQLNGDYSKRYFIAIKDAEIAEKTKNIEFLREVDSRYRIKN